MAVSIGRYRTLVRVLFFAACVLTLWRALRPDPLTEPYIGQMDKVVHATAFFVLSVIGSAAFASRRRIGLGLLGLGILIEFLQMIPALHRDAEFGDVVADSVGIVLGLAVAALALKAIRRL